MKFQQLIKTTIPNILCCFVVCCFMLIVVVFIRFFFLLFLVGRWGLGIKLSDAFSILIPVDS